MKISEIKIIHIESGLNYRNNICWSNAKKRIYFLLDRICKYFFYTRKYLFIFEMKKMKLHNRFLHEKIRIPNNHISICENKTASAYFLPLLLFLTGIPFISFFFPCVHIFLHVYVDFYVENRGFSTLLDASPFP